MVFGIGKTGFNWVCEKVLPTAETTDEKIFTLWAFLGLSQLASGHGRDQPTLVILGLSGRLAQVNEPFVQWIQNPYDRKDIKQASMHPLRALVKSQMGDLICKVTAAVTFYATKDISLYASLTNLLSHSEKISKVAQPILDRVSSLPIPRWLPLAPVIAVAPVIAKLIHMTLIYADPKGESTVLKVLKTGANRTSQGLEFLWNLRFSLLSLGISKSVYSSVFLVIYSQLVKYSGLDTLIKIPLNLLPFVFKSINQGPAQLGLGINGMLNSYKASSAPYNIATLEELFDKANGLKGALDNLAGLQASIEDLKSKISSALKNGEINETHAKGLYELINSKTQEALTNFVLDPNFADRLNDETFLPMLKAIYCQERSEDQATKFIGFLKTLSQWKAPTEDLQSAPEQIHKTIKEMELLEHFKCMTSSHVRACKWAIFKKIEQAFNNIIIPPPFQEKQIDELPQHFENIHNYLRFCTEQLGGSEEVNILRSKTLKATILVFSDKFTLENLLADNYEKTVAAFCNKNGIIHKFVVTKEDQCSAYLTSAEFLLRRFEVNLAWYLDNQETIALEKRKNVELCLLHLALQAILDYQMIAESPEFAQWTIDKKVSRELLEQDLEKLVKSYVKTSPLFDFTRNNLPIPNEFKFETVALPLTIKKSSMDDTKLLIVKKSNFPFPFCTDWDTSTISQAQRETEEMTIMLQQKHRIDETSFLASSTIQAARE